MSTMLSVSILLFICVVISGVIVWKDSENSMLWLTVSGLCGMGCIVAAGYYIGGM